jgi:hypothetical protein
MSTIYTDAAGNKYLGDCRWGNHDINAPTTSYLKAIENSERTLRTTFLSDMLSILTDAGYQAITVAGVWPTTLSANIFTATPPGVATSNYFRLRTSEGNATFRAECPDINNLITTSYATEFSGNDGAMYASNFDYAVCCGPNSIAIMPFEQTSGNQGINSNNWRQFYYWGRLENVNTNFGYYNGSFINHSIVMYTHTTSSTLSSIAVTGYHYIVSAKKTLLTTGRAAYSIACSDGQTPTSQWATDMWVYDNNATLGYPVIGRVPNMLLGTGTYTYLKPVKIQGSAFPDNGSPWYLPVGTFAGKTLLTRCYSSMP